MVCVTSDRRKNSYSRYGETDEENINGNSLELTKNLKPVVYKLKLVDDEVKKKLAENNPGMELPSFYLDYRYEVVPLPKKIYGKVNRLLLHYLTRFDSVDESLEVLLVGDAGSGKTLLSDMICQSCIERGMPVIDISGIDIDNDELSNAFTQFLSQLHNVCIRIDEFGKLIPRYRQQSLLTIMTERHRRIFWVLTENSYDYINNFITGSTHRVRYAQEFSKIDAEVVLGYCRDKNVSDAFIDQLLVLQNRASHFSFTHLMTLVEEHKLFPNMGLDEMISLLNLKHLSTVYTVNIGKIIFCGVDVTESRKSVFGRMSFTGTRGMRRSNNSWGDFVPQATRNLMNKGEMKKKGDELNCTFEDINALIRDKYPLSIEIKAIKDELLFPELGNMQRPNNDQMQPMPMSSEGSLPLDLMEALRKPYNGEKSVFELYLDKKNNPKAVDDIYNLKSTTDDPLTLRNKYIVIETYITSSEDDDEIPISYFKKKKPTNSLI